MVRSVDSDARGILAPSRGLEHFRLDRYAPSPQLARFVDRYWIVRWDLRGRPTFTQAVFAHPVVNVVFGADGATLTGVTTRMTYRTLEGVGRVFGVMFRPAGFRPFLDRPMSSITDLTLPAADVFGDDLDELHQSVATGTADTELVARAEEILAGIAPEAPEASEHTTTLVERIASERTLVRVEQVAALARVGTRQLQRRFANHVGVHPKAVIRRYRIYDAAERARKSECVDWAELAAELGYSDQPHFIRDFTATVGTPPERYLQMCRSHRSESDLRHSS